MAREFLPHPYRQGKWNKEFQAITNAMEHRNYQDAGKNTKAIGDDIDEKYLHIEIEDDGEKFDYSHYKSESEKGNTLSKRGRGIIILRSPYSIVFYKKP